MHRREFIKVIAGSAAAWLFTARGQATKKRPLIGRLSFGSRDTPLIVRYIDRFISGMRELGYVEGRDFDMTYAMADFHADRLPQVAAEMVERAPDVILAGATLEAIAAAKATAKIPIVVGALADPELLGFAANDARPTGNVTGITPYITGLPAKQLELARGRAPRDAHRIAGRCDRSKGPPATEGDRGCRADAGDQDHTGRGADVG
jgi:putative tryptophan/tyrosine transport system substrate-binding protein